MAADRLGESYYHFSVAQMHARAGRMPEAIAQLREAIKRDPKTAALWTQLAQWLARTNQPAEAITAAQKAVELEPDNTSRLPDDGRALSPARAGCPRRRPRWRRSSRIAPQSPDGYLALAQLHFEQKSYDKARAVLLRLIAERPGLAQGYYLLGRIGIETESGTRRSRG